MFFGPTSASISLVVAREIYYVVALVPARGTTGYCSAGSAPTANETAHLVLWALGPFYKVALSAARVSGRHWVTGPVSIRISRDVFQDLVKSFGFNAGIVR